MSSQSNPSRRSIATSITGLALGCGVGLTGCYTVEFDESRSDAYYCTQDSDCGEDQRCDQFRCVSDLGPSVNITGPEAQAELDFDATSIDVTVSGSGLILTDGEIKAEGEGKLEITIDPGSDDEIIVVSDGDGMGEFSGGIGVAVDFGGTLTPGAHRVRVRALYADGGPYTNPSATHNVVFFIEQENTSVPQVAVVFPPQHHIHVVGEPLTLIVSSRGGYTFVDSGDTCIPPDGCDPFDDGCVNEDCGEITREGHSHIYLLDDYPACLNDAPVGCNSKYVASMRPGDQANGGDTMLESEIPGEFFPDAGTFTLTGTLQYNDHDPFPSVATPTYDQITIQIVEK